MPKITTTHIAVCLACLGSLAGCSKPAKAPAPPAETPPPPARNLIMISLDTLRADRLSCYGYGRPTSPKLDALAEDAVLFERAISPANATIEGHHAVFQSQLAGRALSLPDPVMLAETLHDDGFATAAFTGGGTMSERFKFDQGFDVFQTDCTHLAEGVKRGLAWIQKETADDRRFFLFLHTFDVHLPYDPPPPYDTMFAADYRGPIRGNNTKDALRKVRRIFEYKDYSGDAGLDNADRDKIGSLYDGAIRWTDDTLGRLFDALRERGLLENTIVVIFSDHGEEFWDHGSVLHAHTVYQELVHVPLIVWAPGYERFAGRVEPFVSTMDIAPTVLELLGEPAPEHVRGKSLVQAMQHQDTPTRSVISEGYAFNMKPRSIISGGYKLIRYDHQPGRPVELYDLAADPLEQRDLAAKSPELVKQLNDMLDDALRGEPLDAQSPLTRDGEGLDEETLQRLRALGYVD